MTNLREVAAFLLGEGELDGVGFGDPHPTERGNYWWRKHLRAALAQQDHLAGKRKMVAQPEPEELGEVIPADEEQLKRIAKLVEPEPEPWGYISHKSWKMPVFVEADDLQAANLPFNNPDYTPVYKAPPQREWIGLTENEIKHLWYEACQTNLELTSQLIVHLARNIEAKLKAKNA